MTPLKKAIEASRWQPIETAPRDGTHILLLTSDWGAVEGYWNKNVTNFYASQEGWASYDPENMQGDWVSHWNDTDGKERRLFCGQTPHYWMPLPQLPVSYAGGGLPSTQTQQASDGVYEVCGSEHGHSPAPDKCPTCNGDDADAPCAYPGEDMPGCKQKNRVSRLLLVERDALEKVREALSSTKIYAYGAHTTYPKVCDAIGLIDSILDGGEK